MTVIHDNGNHVCFSNGGTYVRQDREYYNSAGMSVPPIAELLAALDIHSRENANRMIGAIADSM